MKKMKADPTNPIKDTVEPLDPPAVTQVKVVVRSKELEGQNFAMVLIDVPSPREFLEYGIILSWTNISIGRQSIPGIGFGPGSLYHGSLCSIDDSVIDRVFYLAPNLGLLEKPVPGTSAVISFPDVDFPDQTISAEHFKWEEI